MTAPAGSDERDRNMRNERLGVRIQRIRACRLNRFGEKPVEKNIAIILNCITEHKLSL